MIIKAGAQNRKILIATSQWEMTWSGLRDRGHGNVESVAVWAGKRDGTTEIVEGIYFLNDFSGGLQHRGYHFVPPEALAKLFAQLQKDRRVLIADVHTHPTSWVGLSEIDKEHPIEFRPGIHEIVLPSFALPDPSLQAAGFHEYKGNGKWRTLSKKEKTILITFT
jgi:hypothetical protein